MRNGILIAVLLCVLMLAFFSCKSSNSTAGPAGASGSNGAVTVTLQNNAVYSGTADVSISAAYPYQNFPNYAGNWVGIYGSGNYYRSLYRFDLSTVIPSNVTIVSAYLTLYPANCGATCISGTTTITAYALYGAARDAWTVTGASWVSSTASTLWAVSSGGGDFSPTPMSDTIVLSDSSTPASVIFTLSASVVQGWLSDPSTNNGFILKASNETTGNNLYTFYSGINGTASLNPILTLYYKAP
jgi:hypothetical protein